MKDFRIVFFGTPEFAVTSAKALVDQGFNVVGIVTATDKPSGRGHKLQSPPMKTFADAHSIKCLQPSNLKDSEFLKELEALKADLQIVVAFRMLPEVVWDMPEWGTYNVHASLLPQYRGAAPINWAIINGEKITGVTTFKLKHEIDTGSILLQKEVNISDDDNAGTLHDKLMYAGAKLITESVDLIGSGDFELKPQDPSIQPKHAPKIFKATCKIDWNRPAREVYNFIRGMSPFPTAFTVVKFSDGTVENWKIFEAKLTDKASDQVGRLKSDSGKLFVGCRDQWIEIATLQVPGKSRVGADEFLRGLRHDLAQLHFE